MCKFIIFFVACKRSHDTLILSNYKLDINFQTPCTCTYARFFSGSLISQFYSSIIIAFLYISGKSRKYVQVSSVICIKRHVSDSETVLDFILSTNIYTAMIWSPLALITDKLERPELYKSFKTFPPAAGSSNRQSHNALDQHG